MLSRSNSRQVKSVQTAFRITHLIQNLDTATQAQLADELDIAKSTLYNYLGTLEELGYIVNRDGSYSLGLRFLTHGMAAKNSLHIGEAVQETLVALSREISLPAWWVTEELGRGIFVERALPEDQQEVYGRLGKRSYLHTHAPGKAILARLSRTDVEEIVDYHGLPVHTNETITEKDALLAELDEIRDRGFAVSSGEAALGIRSVARAFEGPTGSTHAIGVFGHSHDFGGVSIDDGVSKQLETAVDHLESTLEKREISR